MATYFPLPIKSDIKAKKIIQESPYERHKSLVQHYSSLKKTEFQTESELEILKKNHQFIREQGDTGWADRIAIKYYNQLFKEYCLGDFSRYKTGQVGLRWRIKDECINGKGQFICGNLKCERADDLKSWEVLFKYKERDEIKSELVKIRLCPKCTRKLFYKKRKFVEEQTDNERESKRNKQQEPPDETNDAKDETTNHKEENVKNEDEEEEKIGNVWTEPVKLENEATIEEEMDAFLAEMFM
jgi:protein FRA10AC1